jgi:hypothetical protein
MEFLVAADVSKQAITEAALMVHPIKVGKIWLVVIVNTSDIQVGSSLQQRESLTIPRQLLRFFLKKLEVT